MQLDRWNIYPNRFKQGCVFYKGMGLFSPPICSCGGLILSVIWLAPLKSHPCSKVADFVRQRMALSVEPCLETHKTAKPAIHGRSVYNLPRPLTAKQPAQIHPGPLWGGEEQSNYILKQQSEASSAHKQTSSTLTDTDRFGHNQCVCSIHCRVLLSFRQKYV